LARPITPPPAEPSSSKTIASGPLQRERKILTPGQGTPKRKRRRSVCPDSEEEREEEKRKEKKKKMDEEKENEERGGGS